MSDPRLVRPSAGGRHRRWLPPGVAAAGPLTATSWPSARVPEVRDGDRMVPAVLDGGLTRPPARVEPAPIRRPAGAALLVAGRIAFGAADEWHRLLIPGRAGAVGDWIADGAGAALGLVAAFLLRREQPA